MFVPGIRVDTGIRQGDASSINYDPMIAKLTVHAPTSPDALRRLRAALSDYEVAGVKNQPRPAPRHRGQPRFNAGAVVAKGTILIVLEAMKVQMRLAAPRDGTIAAIRAQPGDLVEEATELVEFAPLPAAG